VTVSALEVYEQELRALSRPFGSGTERCWVRYADGRRRQLPVKRWAAAADAADLRLVRRCHGPTLDVGCGPGRLTAALTVRGVPALGIDVAPLAVRLTRESGAAAIRRSVFDRIPGEGRWTAVLLADGNVGIGGEPGRLLSRCAELITCDGSVLVELDPPGTTSRTVAVRLERGDARSAWFRWAHLDTDDLAGTAAEAGLAVHDRWTVASRWFAELIRA